jgi:hypothetical protein
MSLIKQHAQENEQDAMRAMHAVAKRIISKYMVLQRNLNVELSGGRGVGKEPCILCKIDQYTKKMAKLEMQVGQVTKTYKLMFGEELDLTGITDDASREYYPLTMPGSKRRRAVNDEGDTFIIGSEGFGDGDDMPDEVRDIIATVNEALRKKGKGGRFDVHAVNVRDIEQNYGLNPKDYNSPLDFFKAVKAASKAHNSGKSPMEIIKDSIIESAEADAKDGGPIKGPKNKKNTPEDPKLN